MDKKIKLGCIGLGARACSIVESSVITNSKIELYAICDKDPEAMESFKEKFKKEKFVESVKCFSSYEEMLKSDVEAIYVATDISTHCDISIDCLNAGKHVLCEIPNIANEEDAKRLKEAVVANPKQKFMVAENCCYWAFIESWKEMYEKGLLGEIVYAESDYLHKHKSTLVDGKLGWRAYLSSITYLTHNLGPLLYILDDRCDEITGFIPNINPIEDIHPAPPNGVAMIKTKKGTLIKIYIGFGIHHMYAHNFAMYGSKGSVENQRGKELRDAKTVASLDSVPYTQEAIEIPVTTAFPNTANLGHGGADPKMVDAFIDCIIKDEKPPLDIDFGIDIALSGIYADMSSKNGGKMYKIPEVI
ncbi:MAG: Gfo/Idh/MocA family oxidoreductase [Clostridia bacterium]|nr:Gfo/Idh/MocA family oxidoreductase [Clostridia bacterium]